MRRQIPGFILFCLAVWMCALTFTMFRYPNLFLGNSAEGREQVAPTDKVPEIKSSGDEPGDLTTEVTEIKPKEEKPPEISILVAAKDLKWDEIGEIQANMVTAEPFPTHLLPDGYIHANELQNFIGQILMVDLNAGDPLLRYQVHRDQARLIEDRTPLNQRAMAVKVDEVIGVGGFIKPYSRVDVLVTLPDRKPPETFTVLRNVVVLAAGDRGDRAEAPALPDGTISSWSNNVKSSFVSEQSKGEQQGPTKVTVVTLQVSPSQAEKLALAASEGQLRLVLRNPLDKEPGKTQGIDLKTFLDDGRPSKRQGPPKQRVDVYKGSTFETQYVRKQ